MSQSVRPGNRERGWNDPPEFLHSEEQASTAPKKTVLSQRVSHSLDGLKATPGLVDNETDTKLTEPPKLSAPPTSQIILDTKVENTAEEVPISEISVQDIESIFSANIQYLRDNEVGGRTCDDILKRVKIFLTNWPKLNEIVKSKMWSLAQALDNSEFSTANDLHVRLMLDFPSEVSQWMVGVKKLIHELIELKEKTETDQITENSITNSI